jgi:hypothetical protein
VESGVPSQTLNALDMAALERTPRAPLPRSMVRNRWLAVLACVAVAAADVIIGVPLSMLSGPDPWSPREIWPAAASFAAFTLPLPLLVLGLLLTYERVWRRGILVRGRVLRAQPRAVVLGLTHPALGEGVIFVGGVELPGLREFLVIVSPTSSRALVITGEDVVRATVMPAEGLG